MADRRKIFGAAALTAAIAGGGVAGALLGIPGTSGADPGAAPAAVGAAFGGGGRARAGGPGGADLAVAAEALGITEDELDAALEDGSTIADVAAERGVDVQTVIDALVADRADDVRAALEARITALVNGEGPFGGGGPGFGPGIGRHHVLGLALDVAADALGMTDEELRTALEDGSSVADVADERGVEVQAVVDALVAAGTERIDGLVEDGRIDADEAEEMKADLAERLRAAVDGDWPRHGPGGPGLGHGGPHRGHDGDAEGTEDDAGAGAEGSSFRTATA